MHNMLQFLGKYANFLYALSHPISIHMAKILYTLFLNFAQFDGTFTQAIK